MVIEAQTEQREDGEWAVSLESLETDGLRMLGLARAAQAEAHEDVENVAQPLDPASDQPIESETSISPPETPDLKQPEVEGAVT